MQNDTFQLPSEMPDQAPQEVERVQDTPEITSAYSLNASLGHLGLEEAARQIDENDRNKEWHEQRNSGLQDAIKIGQELERLRTINESDNNLEQAACGDIDV